jgi:hypothetical protein
MNWPLELLKYMDECRPMTSEESRIAGEVFLREIGFEHEYEDAKRPSAVEPGLAAQIARHLIGELRELYGRLIQDTSGEDSAIRKTAREFLPEAECEHDGYSVVPLVDVVENMAKRMRASLVCEKCGKSMIECGGRCGIKPV